ncbi:MAG: glycosyltransferase [Muribaculaceae bacterium]|nr:glycosyltransferase [Muribaculaceae bacterium]
MNPKVSIIVPAYNAAVFLDKTVRSILDQSYRHIEIILVNDCSTDNTLQIIQKFARLDKRVKVVDKQKNEGEDYARFSGIEVATGDYFAFLDSDDWFAPDAIETMVGIAERKKVDIVYTPNWRVFSSRLGIKHLCPLDSEFCNRIIDGKEKDELFISYFGVNIVPVTMWGALFDRKLFTPDLTKSGLKFGADLALSMQLYHNAQSFYMSDKPTVFYRWGGVTAKFQPNFLSSSKVLFRKKIDFAKKLNFDRAIKTSVIELANCLASHIVQLAEYYPSEREENIRKIIEEMSDPVYSCFAEFKDDKYFKDGNMNTFCVRLDAERAYDIAAGLRKSPKGRIRHYSKRLASFLLKYIRL